MINPRELLEEARERGVIPRPGTTDAVVRMDRREARNIARSVARDEAPNLTPMNSIPWQVLNVFNLDLIRVLFAPLAADLLTGTTPIKRGDFATQTTTFRQIEPVGDVQTYGDFSHEGSVETIKNFPIREVYRFQTTLRVGDLEEAQWSEARISELAEKEQTAAQVINIAHNKIELFGVNGMNNFGLLTDPDANPSIAPTQDPNSNPPNATQWPEKTPTGIINDVNALKNQINVNTQGLVPDNSNMILAISYNRSADLNKTNEFGLFVKDVLQKNYPNLEIVMVPELATAAGEIAMLIVPEIQGRRTLDTAFNERYRSHGVVRKLSSVEEKKSAGSWGGIVYYPMAIATMIGI